MTPNNKFDINYHSGYSVSRYKYWILYLGFVLNTIVCIGRLFMSIIHGQSSWLWKMIYLGSYRIWLKSVEMANVLEGKCWWNRWLLLFLKRSISTPFCKFGPLSFFFLCIFGLLGRNVFTSFFPPCLVGSLDIFFWVLFEPALWRANKTWGCRYIRLECPRVPDGWLIFAWVSCQYPSAFPLSFPLPFLQVRLKLCIMWASVIISQT